MPVTYPRLFVELAAERGLDPALLLARAGIPAATMASPAGRISHQDFADLAGIIVELSGDEGIGLEVGLRQPLTAHGNLGLAMMCSPTAGAAVQLLQRFWHLRGRGIELERSEQDDTVIFDFQNVMPMAPPVRRVLVDSVIASFHRGLAFALGNSDTRSEIWFEYPEPPWISRFRDRLPALRYNMPRTQYRGPRHLLGHPLATASPETLATAVSLCERELALLDEDLDHIVATARAALSLGAAGYPDPEQLAARLHMSTRTFRRRLLLQGSNYRQLLEDARRRDALHLLDSPSLEIQQIATLLGYADPANFTRAFRGWTGKTPSGYRELRGASEHAD
jgi:AraC-like DNA-binding protein